MSLYCEICTLSFSRRFNYNRHLCSDRHGKNISKLAAETDLSSTVTTPQYNRYGLLDNDDIGSVRNRPITGQQSDDNYSKNPRSADERKLFASKMSRHRTMTGDDRSSHADTDDACCQNTDDSGKSEDTEDEEETLYWSDDFLSDKSDDKSYVSFDDYQRIKDKCGKDTAKFVKNSILLRVNMKLRNGSLKIVAIRWIKINQCNDISLLGIKKLCKTGVASKKELHIVTECVVNVMNGRAPLTTKEYQELRKKRLLLRKLAKTRMSLTEKHKLLKRNQSIVKLLLSPVIKLLRSAKYRGKDVE
jgi:hypothetical protein